MDEEGDILSGVSREGVENHLGKFHAIGAAPHSQHAVRGLLRVLVDVNLGAGGLPNGHEVTAVLAQHLREYRRWDGDFFGPVDETKTHIYSGLPL